MEAVFLKSYPKINLFLEVLGKNQETGYHNLQTLMVQVQDVYDVIEINKHINFKVEVNGKFAFKGTNILEKVERIFKERFGTDVDTNFKVLITKNIKTEGGMGGGSSNACAFLKFLLQVNNIELNREEFSSLAMKVGADVTFFYDEKPKLCTGSGEILNDLSFKLPHGLSALLVMPNFSISTADVFKQFTPKDFHPLVTEPRNFAEVLKKGNDLEKYAINLHPEIKEIINEISVLKGCLKGGISGSGSTCFGLFESFEEAQIAEETLSKLHDVKSTHLQL